MHYAEFAEDEVDAHIPPPARNPGADLIAERRALECNQGIRDQQVEGHRTEGREARKGMLFVPVDVTRLFPPLNTPITSRGTETRV